MFLQSFVTRQIPLKLLPIFNRDHKTKNASKRRKNIPQKQKDDPRNIPAKQKDDSRNIPAQQKDDSMNTP